MKKQYLMILFLTALISFVAGACKKDKSPDPAPSGPSERTQMLQAHSWRYNSYFYYIKNNQAIPYLLPSCMADDKLDYHANSKYIKDAGQVLCTGQPQYDTLGWELMQSDMKLKITSKTTSITKEILSFTSDSLVTLEVNPNGDSMAYLYLKY